MLELEFALLGGLIADGSKAGEHIASLRPEDFEEPVCRSVFGAIRALFNRRDPVDRISLLHELGEDYAPALDEAAQRATSEVAYYSQLLRQGRRLKEAQKQGFEITNAQSLDDIPPALDKLNALMVQRRDRRPVPMSEALQRFMDRHSGEPPEYLKWGLPPLDDKLYCEPGDFVVIGGYPSAGKTLLASQFALELAKRYRVGFFSLETSADKLTDRMMAYKTQIPMSRIKKNQLSEEDWKACTRAAEELNSLQFEEISASGMTATDIQAYSLSRGYEVIFVDYLQLVQDGSKGGRYEQVTNISLTLHTLAQSCGITVVALAQLSRPDKTVKKPQPPNMSSFRESGQIEQDADVALLLYQEDLDNNAGRRVLKIGKNKEGERFAIILDFNGETQTLRPAKRTASEQHQAAMKACNRARKERSQQQSIFKNVDDDREDPPF